MRSRTQHGATAAYLSAKLYGNARELDGERGSLGRGHLDWEIHLHVYTAGEKRETLDVLDVNCMREDKILLRFDKDKKLDVKDPSECQ